MYYIKWNTYTDRQRHRHQQRQRETAPARALDERESVGKDSARRPHRRRQQQRRGGVSLCSAQSRSQLTAHAARPRAPRQEKRPRRSRSRALAKYPTLHCGLFGQANRFATSSTFSRRRKDTVVRRFLKQKRLRQHKTVRPTYVELPLLPSGIFLSVASLSNFEAIRGNKRHFYFPFGFLKNLHFSVEYLFAVLSTDEQASVSHFCAVFSTVFARSVSSHAPHEISRGRE